MTRLAKLFTIELCDAREHTRLILFAKKENIFCMHHHGDDKYWFSSTEDIRICNECQEIYIKGKKVGSRTKYCSLRCYENHRQKIWKKKYYPKLPRSKAYKLAHK